MDRFIQGWARLVVRGRWLVLALAAIAAALSFIPIQNIYYDNSNENYFVEGDPNLESFNQLLELFGDVEYLSIGVIAPSTDADVFTPGTLQVIHELTQFLETRPEVTQVRSLSKYQYTHSDGGLMSTDDLIEDLEDPAALAEARRVILGEPIAMGSLVTEDLRHTRIVARTRYQVGSTDGTMSLMKAMREFVEKQQFDERGYPLHLSGQPVFTEQFEVLTKRDQAWHNVAP